MKKTARKIIVGLIALTFSTSASALVLGTGGIIEGAVKGSVTGVITVGK